MKHEVQVAEVITRSAGIAFLVVLAGCAAQSALVPVQFGYTDVPAKRQVEVTYRNNEQVPMCLLPEHWPNPAGKINQASDSVALVVGSERFPIANFNTGYCPDGCATRVAPGEQVSRAIPYSDFALPERLVDSQKTLEFAPMAFACNRR